MGSHDKRVDNNFGELLQEFRVAQQGVQILFAFLLSLPFQARFEILENNWQQWLYGLALMLTLLSTILFVAPVAHHRMLFHQGLKAVIVDYASSMCLVALAMMLASMLISIFIVIGAVLGIIVASVLTFVGALAAFIYWYVKAVQFKRGKDD